MTIEEAFLRDILEAPDDDAPRLVYADWLDDHADAEPGRARAALIRAQCQAERLPAGAARRELEAQARQLLRTHAKEWLAPLRKARLGASGWQFRRGFVDHVALSARRFVQVAWQLFALAPVRSVRFPEASNEVAELAACPHLARLRAVGLGQMCACGFCPIHAELRTLFRSRHLAQLTTLVLVGDRLNADMARALADAPRLGRLTTLDLSDNRLGTAGARALAGATRFTALRSLDLSGNGIGPLGALALAQAPWLAGLTSLNLADNAVRDAGARALADSPNLGADVRLDLSRNRLGVATSAALREQFGRRVRL